jgi:hypothetical protein
MRIESVDAVGNGAIYISQIKPVSQFERLARIEKRENIRKKIEMDEMMEFTRQWLKPDWLGQNIDIYI